MDTLKNSAKILMDPKVSLEKKKESFRRAFGVAKSSFVELTSPGTVSTQSSEFPLTFILTFVVFFVLVIVVFVYAFKSISVMCPGAWSANPIKFGLLLGLVFLNGPIAFIYIIAAYAVGFKFKDCK